MAIKRVYSAGGIVVRDFDGEKKVLVSQSSAHHGWDFPKGHIESGESAEMAAIREVFEETGVKAEIVEKIGTTEYFYFEDKEKVFKTVVFFLMKYIEQGEATTAFEVEDMEWLLVDDVGAKLTFKDTKKLWSSMEARIKKSED